MKHFKTILWCAILFTAGRPAFPADLKLWYDQAAREWIESLPSALADGDVKGLRARGGFEVDLVWADGDLESATIKSIRGGLCRLKYNDQLIEFETEASTEYRFDGSLRGQS